MPKPVSSLEVRWLPAPEEHDYPAAESYLLLLMPKEQASGVTQRLREAPGATFAAKDIFRASGLVLLDLSNTHVAADLEKLRSDKALSPILLMRDSAHARVVIADGYHRLCAVYHVDENAQVPCRIV